MTTIEKMTDPELRRLLAEKGMGWNDRVCDSFRFDPLTDANDMLMLIEAIFKRFKIRTYFTMEYNGNYSVCCLSKIISPKHDYSTDLKRAVCLVAAKALAADTK